ncbi:MAG: acyl-CoA desaturase, partial [Gammaproteobacteria bacterium]|nr:acyl-CoA desaturase [Gammaproteobacteria bacterium]
AFAVLAPTQTTASAVILFFATTYLTLLLGHSVGMHRKLIHCTYSCSKPLERLLVYLGVLVGMAGPFGILKVHDLRDWAQRVPQCHDFFSHRAPLWLDAFWQLHCRFEFDTPPDLRIEDAVLKDPWYRFLNATWILQQLPVAMLLYWIGGLPWVVWGVFARVFVSVTGHWVVTYYTHNPGPGRWLVPGAGVQASNLPGLGFLTMGECWHNNHHAFPESARMGLDSDQFDPGWSVIRWFERFGWVWDVGLPRGEERREDLLQTAA